MIRAKDLAEKLGVSAATVSLVLNDKPGICENTRRELRKRIAEMGYGYMLRTSEPAEAKSSEARGTIAFVIYPVCKECGDTSSFYSLVMEGVSAYLQENGYEMLVYHVKPECGCTLRCLSEKNVKGMIVQKPCLKEIDIQELIALELPFVMLDTYYMDEEISSVSVNNEQGVYKLIRHLQTQGHEHIGYISCDLERATFDERKGYYHMILSQLGLAGHPDWSISLSDEEKLQKALQDPQGPTAFLTDNDIIAWKAIQKIRALGYPVPGKIAVAGYEDHSLGAMSDPPITTVHVPDTALGREAARMLLSKIGRQPTEPDIPVKIELGVQLVVRESTCRHT